MVSAGTLHIGGRCTCCGGYLLRRPQNPPPLVPDLCSDCLTCGGGSPCDYATLIIDAHAVRLLAAAANGVAIDGYTLAVASRLAEERLEALPRCPNPVPPADDAGPMEEWHDGPAD